MPPGPLKNYDFSSSHRWQSAAFDSDRLRARYRLNTSADQLQARADVHQSRLQLISSIAQYLEVYAKLSVAIGVPALAAR